MAVACGGVGLFILCSWEAGEREREREREREGEETEEAGVSTWRNEFKSHLDPFLRLQAVTMASVASASEQRQ
jgi:hypothetical protein